MILFLIILIPALLFFWNRFFVSRWSKGLHARLSFTEKTAYAGDQAELKEVISNQKRLPLPAVEMGFRIPKGVRFLDAENIVTSDYVYKRDVFSLRGMEAVTRRYHLECLRRGRYPISQVTLRTWTLFRHTQYLLDSEQTDQLTVYAKRTDVSSILAYCDTILGEKESSRSLYEDPFAFASIREYSPTDPMKNINWKASARMGSLMVNTYSSVRSEQFFVFLDVSDEGIWKEEELVEKGISAASTLCQKLIQKGLEIGLAVNTDPPVVFEPKRGREQLQQMELFLTEDFSKRELCSFGHLTELPIPVKDRICVYITRDADAVREGRKQSAGGVLVTPVLKEGVPVLQVRSAKMR